MKHIGFEWDKAKEVSNYKKHKVRFSEATTVFCDENAREYDDPEHSEDEERFLMLGMSQNLRVLVISFCYRNSENRIRIISSRKANKKETMAYFAGGRK